jgi:hypothetical protein
VTFVIEAKAAIRLLKTALEAAVAALISAILAFVDILISGLLLVRLGPEGHQILGYPIRQIQAY